MERFSPNPPLAAQCSLEQLHGYYRDAYRTLIDLGDDASVLDRCEFLKVVLCGRWPGCLNARQGAHVPRVRDCMISRDFDFLIGITDSLPYTIPLEIFPVPSFRDTLTHSVHHNGTVFVTPESVRL